MSDLLVADRPAAAATPAPAHPAASAPGRLRSLDVFRGITVAGMLLVNNPGSWSYVYRPLDHAEWEGWTPTDLIFPAFLFIVGVAMTFSFGAALARGTPRRAVMARAARRGAVLFGLGLVLAAFPYYALDVAHLRIPGVLQRIGVCFVLASAVVLFTGPRAQAWITGAVLLGYWAAMMLVPVPGYGAGQVLSKDGNLAAYVDRAVLGTGHLWAAAKTWDPEGILSTLPAACSVLLGVFAGRWIRGGRTPERRAAGLLLAGGAAIAVGGIWGMAFPIAKNLWTSSYVLLTGGMAMVLLAACHWLVDVRGRAGWARPFEWFGTNAIAAFFLSGLAGRIIQLVPVGTRADGKPLVTKQWAFEHAFASWLPPYPASLAFAVSFVLLFTAVVYAMHRRRIFIKI
jgi:predicted acyltransferase